MHGHVQCGTNSQQPRGGSSPNVHLQRMDKQDVAYTDDGESTLMMIHMFLYQSDDIDTTKVFNFDKVSCIYLFFCCFNHYLVQGHKDLLCVFVRVLTL